MTRPLFNVAWAASQQVEVSGWRDAAGHATLWNGRICYDHCYFNEQGAAYRTDRANFWSLQ